MSAPGYDNLTIVSRRSPGATRRDVEGTESPDIHAAREQAIRTSGELLRDMGAKF
jgi:hypothetical protein